MKRFVFQAFFCKRHGQRKTTCTLVCRAAALEARDAVLQLFSQDEGESASDQSEGTVAHIADIHGDPNDIVVNHIRLK